MSHTPLSHTKSRRDLAGSLRRSRPRKHARLRHRHLHAERLEDRRLLAYADFELSSLLPANGGDGSSGFVVNGITDQGKLGWPPATVPSRWATSIRTASTTSTWRPPGHGGPSHPRPGVHNLRPSEAQGGFPAELDLPDARRHNRLRD